MRTTLPWCLAAVLAAITSAGLAAEPGPAPALRLRSIEPTVFFVNAAGGLHHVAQATVENPGEAVEASLEIGLPGGKTSAALGRIAKGRSTVQFRMPEVRHAAKVEFSLVAGQVVHDRRTVEWRPQRHWEVCFVPISHHDLGYTDTLENVLRQYDGFYDDVLRFCEETEDWPEESRFRYTVEGAWSLQHFLANRPPVTAEKLAKYARQGRFEIPALIGNEVTNLCGHEQLIRSLYPSARLAKQLGV